MVWRGVAWRGSGGNGCVGVGFVRVLWGGVEWGQVSPGGVACDGTGSRRVALGPLGRGGVGEGGVGAVHEMKCEAWSVAQQNVGQVIGGREASRTCPVRACTAMGPSDLGSQAARGDDTRHGLLAGNDGASHRPRPSSHRHKMTDLIGK